MPSRAAGSSFLTYSFGTRTAIQGQISFSAVQHTVFSLLSTADFLSNLFLAVTHLFFPRIITADFAFSLFPLSRTAFFQLSAADFTSTLILDAVLNEYTIYDSRNLSSDIAKNPSAAAPAASKGSLFMFFYD